MDIRKKVELLEKKDNDKLIDLWNEFMDYTSDPYSVFEMDDFDEAMEDLTPKEIMQFSNGNFNPDHKYYAYDEDITAYISFDDLSEYEPYTNRKEDFIKFLSKKEMEELQIDDEGICLADGIEYEEGNQESLENAIDQLLKKIEMLTDDDM